MKKFEWQRSDLDEVSDIEIDAMIEEFKSNYEVDVLDDAEIDDLLELYWTYYGEGN